MRFVAAALIGFCALLAICVGIARATAGGSTIASALIVTPGVSENGTTASYTDSCQNGFEFWTLQLTQGDLVKITWSASPAVDTLALWPAATADADDNGCLYPFGLPHWMVSPVVQDSSGSAQMVATTTGRYPLLFLDTTGVPNAGPFSFTAVVLHAASVTLPHISALPGAGSLTASVLAPDSSPISDSTLKLTLKGYWGARAHTIATATPTDGSATFNYSLPASLWGKKIRLEITGGGAKSNYQAVTSREQSVKVLVSTEAAILVPSSALKTASKLLRQPIYWAGRRKGLHYEFTRLTNGNVYVRYLPHGVRAGDPRGKFLIVATYRIAHAYRAVKTFCGRKAVAGAHGSIYCAYPTNPKSVYVAFPNVNYEIEVYDPNPALSLKIVATGQVVPVR
jgi:hypothetical protein